MRIWRAISVGVFSAMLMSCACSHRGGTGTTDANTNEIPMVEGEGPLKDVFFDFDSSALTPTAQNTLRDDAKWLLDNPGVNVTVEGHCDERGTNEYNMALGERRARATMMFTKSLGVPASRMSTISYGEEMPLDNGHNEAAWAKNRRSHFRPAK